jgi:hypothetical protein
MMHYDMMRGCLGDAIKNVVVLVATNVEINEPKKDASPNEEALISALSNIIRIDAGISNAQGSRPSRRT